MSLGNGRAGSIITEAEQLLRSGAARVDWGHPKNADFVVLADPEGTLFCVMSTSAAI